MAKKTELKERGTGEVLYPITTTDCVITNNGRSIKEEYATKQYADEAAADILNSSPEQLQVINTLGEKLADDSDLANAVTKTVADSKKALFIDMWTSLSARFQNIDFIYDETTDKFGFQYVGSTNYRQIIKEYEIKNVSYEDALRIFSTQTSAYELTQNPYSGVKYFNIPAYGYNQGSGRELSFRNFSLLSLDRLEVLILSTCVGGSNYISGLKIGNFNSDCSSLKAIIEIVILRENTTIYASNLEYFLFSYLAYNLSLPLSSKLRIEALQYLVNTAKGATPITVTVHPNIYAKILGVKPLFVNNTLSVTEDRVNTLIDPTHNETYLFYPSSGGSRILNEGIKTGDTIVLKFVTSDTNKQYYLLGTVGNIQDSYGVLVNNFAGGEGDFDENYPNREEWMQLKPDAIDKQITFATA